MENNILNKAWPEWRAVRVLGKGSYGTVYEAERCDSQIETKSAIKVISVPQDHSEVDSLRSEGMTEDSARIYFKEVVDDFIEEIKIMESFKGVQNIVSVEDYKVIEKEDGIGWDIYIRMELLTPFNTYITDRVLNEKEIVRLGMDICTALELCARRNVIHRDIKPENIFVNSFGDFKLGDFGIARKLENVSGGLSLKGTYTYMAPEVERGSNYDATADIYSLGLVLYRLANNNRLPFLDTEKQTMSPNERQEAARRRLNGEKLPVPQGVSDDLAQVILCACSFEPERRFANAGAMKNALGNVLDGKKSQKAAASKKTEPDKTSVADDKTVSVKPPAAADKTVSVRAAASSEPEYRDEQHVAEPDHLSQKRGISVAAISAIIAAVVILIVAALIIIPWLSDKNNSGTTVTKESETTSVSNSVSQPESAITVQTEQTVETAASQTAETGTGSEMEVSTSSGIEESTSSGIELSTGSIIETSAANAAEAANTPTGSAEQVSGSDSAVIVIPSLNAGDVVLLGNYEQDNNISNGKEPIEWIVLYEENGAHLLLSRYALDAKPYDSNGTCSSWDNCSLRSWLNSDFYDLAFSSAEKNIIIRSELTDDMVSLLRYEPDGDAGVTYFLTTGSSRACYATAYAIANGAWVTDSNGHSPWWLRNMVSGEDNAYMVKSTGEIGNNVITNGASASDISEHLLVTVRPIIWIKN